MAVETPPAVVNLLPSKYLTEQVPIRSRDTIPSKAVMLYLTFSWNLHLDSSR